MPLWGAGNGNNSKPKYLSSTEAARTVATNEGWTYFDLKDRKETLVSIGGLVGRVGNAAITTAAFAAPLPVVGQAQTFHAVVGFLTPVTVVGSPTIVARSSNATQQANVTLTYVPGASNPAAGMLSFASAATNLASVTNVTFTVGGTGAISGGTITGANGGANVSFPASANAVVTVRA